MQTIGNGGDDDDDDHCDDIAMNTLFSCSEIEEVVVDHHGDGDAADDDDILAGNGTIIGTEASDTCSSIVPPSFSDISGINAHVYYLISITFSS